MLQSRVNRLQSFSTRTKSAKLASLPLMNQSVCWPCTHPPGYVLPFPDLFYQNINSGSQMQLHIFVFDEELKSLRGLGTAIDLLPFYNTGVSIAHACFVHGSEEILFVDSSAQARIFSLITLQPKYFLLLILTRIFLMNFLKTRLFTTVTDPTCYLFIPRWVMCTHGSR